MGLQSWLDTVFNLLIGQFMLGRILGGLYPAFQECVGNFKSSIFLRDGSTCIHHQLIVAVDGQRCLGVFFQLILEFILALYYIFAKTLSKGPD